MSAEDVWEAMRTISRRREAGACDDPDQGAQEAIWRMVLTGLDLEAQAVARVATARAQGLVETRGLDADLLDPLWILVFESLAAGVLFERQRSDDSVGDQRDHWIRLFNRLDAAINHHKRDVEAGGLADDPDERLWKARDRILRDAAG